MLVLGRAVKLSAAEERHEKALRETRKVRREAVDVAIGMLVYDLERSSTEAWALVDRLRAECARLVLVNRALEGERDDWKSRSPSMTAPTATQEKPDADLHQG